MVGTTSLPYWVSRPRHPVYAVPVSGFMLPETHQKRTAAFSGSRSGAISSRANHVSGNRPRKLQHLGLNLSRLGNTVVLQHRAQADARHVDSGEQCGWRLQVVKAPLH